MKSESSTSSRSATETYAIDPVHSSVSFSLRHFVGKATGRFTKFEGIIIIDRADPEKSSIALTIDASSVSTAEEKRDEHLKSPDFFDANEFGSITFKSRSWKKQGSDSYVISGDLTLRGITQPVAPKVQLLGFGPGMQDALLCGWEGAATIRRSDFGINGPAYLGTMLGNDVLITFAIEGVLKK
jgi:polyisoprenoid-binding protein YceI